MARRKPISDRESIAALVTVLTPIARRIATDKELRDELRAAAGSVSSAYHRARVSFDGVSGGHVRAAEEPWYPGGQSQPVEARVVDAHGRTLRRGRRVLRVGLAAGAAGAAALLAAKGSGSVTRGAGRLLKRGPRSQPR